MKMNFFKNHNNELDINSLKEILILYHYPHLELDKNNLLKEMERELIITPSFNNYGCASSWLLSMNGSPPKGQALFLEAGRGGEELFVDIVLIGRPRVSRPFEYIKLATDLRERILKTERRVIKK